VVKGEVSEDARGVPGGVGARTQEVIHEILQPLVRPVVLVLAVITNHEAVAATRRHPGTPQLRLASRGRVVVLGGYTFVIVPA